MIVRRLAFCNVDTKIQLFISFCHNIYRGSLWTNYTVECMRRLTVVHNDILRKLTKSPRFRSASELFAQLNLTNLKSIIRKSVSGLVLRLEKAQTLLYSVPYKVQSTKIALYSMVCLGKRCFCKLD